MTLADVKKIAVLGAGTMGPGIAQIYATTGCEVTMWTKFEKERDDLLKTRKNEALLPDFTIDKSIKITCDVEECIKDKE